MVKIAKLVEEGKCFKCTDAIMTGEIEMES